MRNAVNAEDFRRVARRLSRGQVRQVLEKLGGATTEARVIRAWSETGRSPAQWFDIERVRERWAHMVSGDPEVDFRRYVASKYLRGKPPLRALSIGCGMGDRELGWAELGVFESIDAFDISPQQIDEARRKAAERGFGSVVNFTVATLDGMDLPVGRYDAVLAEHSLHHFSSMGAVVGRLSDTLKPDGYFFVDEYVGPTRFQWTDRQLEAANGLLALLPQRYRHSDIGVRRRVIRPSVLWMMLSDPSEAIESAKILPALRETFEVVEERGYGGSVLHIALTDISQNFMDDSCETRRLLDLCFEFEDRLLAEGEVGHDFVALVCRKRPVN